MVTDLLKELSALPINPFMQNGVHLEMASQEEDVMESIETSRIQIVEPTTESFPAAGEGNWSLVSGKQPGVSMGSPKFPKDDDVTYWDHHLVSALFWIWSKRLKTLRSSMRRIQTMW